MGVLPKKPGRLFLKQGRVSDFGLNQFTPFSTVDLRHADYIILEMTTRIARYPYFWTFNLPLASCS